MYINSRNAQHYACFSEMRAKCKRPQRADRFNYISNIKNVTQINVKAFWKHVNSLTNTNKIPDIVHFGEVSSRNAQHSSKLFAHHFKFSYNYNRTDSNAAGQWELNLHVHINVIDVTLNDVHNELSKLKNDKGAGPDEISNLFLTNVVILCHIRFNYYLKNLYLLVFFLMLGRLAGQCPFTKWMIKLISVIIAQY